MPRNSAGNFSLVAGNPVISGEVIASTWANSTMSDLAVAMTDSLDRRGRGGMLAPFEFDDGTNLLPGATWTDETTTGFYRFGAGDLRVAVLTQDIMRWQTTGADVWNNTLAQWEGLLTDGGGGTKTTVNVGTATGQLLRWNTDTVDEEFWENTSGMVIDDAGNVGIGTTTPDGKLEVSAATGIVEMRVRCLDSTASAQVKLGNDTSADAGSLVVGGSTGFGQDQVGLFANEAGSSLVLGTAATEQMRIDDIGNVGIGTAEPMVVLHVLVGATAPLSWSYATADVATFDQSSSNARVQIVAANNLISGVQFSDPDDRGIGRIQYNHADDSIQLWSNGVEQMRIDSGGNMIINNMATSPGVSGALWSDGGVVNITP